MNIQDPASPSLYKPTCADTTHHFNIIPCEKNSLLLATHFKPHLHFATITTIINDAIATFPFAKFFGVITLPILGMGLMLQHQ